MGRWVGDEGRGIRESGKDGGTFDRQVPSLRCGMTCKMGLRSGRGTEVVEPTSQRRDVGHPVWWWSWSWSTDGATLGYWEESNRVMELMGEAREAMAAAATEQFE